MSDIRIQKDTATETKRGVATFKREDASGNLNNAAGTVNNPGNNGNFWSSTVNSATNGRNLNVNSSNVNPQNNNNFSNAFAVRCAPRNNHPFFYYKCRRHSEPPPLCGGGVESASEASLLSEMVTARWRLQIDSLPPCASPICKQACMGLGLASVPRRLSAALNDACLMFRNVFNH